MKKWMMIPAAVLLAIILLLFFTRGEAIAPEGEDPATPSVCPKEVEKQQAEQPDAAGKNYEDIENEVIGNVWILTSEESQVTFFADGKERTLPTRGTLSEPVSSCIADLTVTDGRITRLVVKEDTISAKVLAADAEGIELEGYGRLSYAAQKRIYRMYDGIAEETAEKLLVGGRKTVFVLEDGKVCAALMQEKPDLTKIRVLIGTNGYTGVLHETVEITSETAFMLQCGETEELFAAGESCRLTVRDFETQDKRRVFSSCIPDGKLIIKGLKRKQGQPAYRGTLEISKSGDGLLIVNELPIEEYLYAVLPSEMPTEFPNEALKTQAICARSYAVTALLSARYSAYGAHVDDSVASQVYNNISECENSIRAVKETHGQILQFEGEPATAYYFSASCGYGAAIEDVWESGKKLTYLPGTFHQVSEKSADNTKSESVSTIASEPNEKEMPKKSVYPSEEELYEFLTHTGTVTYDSESPWYRWQVFLPLSELEDNLLTALKVRYKEVPEQILTYDPDRDCYESKTPEKFGELLSVRVQARGSGGIVTELLIIGSRQSFLVKNEYNIRSVLAPFGQLIYRYNADPVSGSTLLPSAFLILSRGEYKGEEGYLVIGGGNGHGVGMSQYGAKKMAENGYLCEEIIEEYYPGTTLGFIYK